MPPEVPTDHLSTPALSLSPFGEEGVTIREAGSGSAQTMAFVRPWAVLGIVE